MRSLLDSSLSKKTPAPQRRGTGYRLVSVTIGRYTMFSVTIFVVAGVELSVTV